ncbi:MAG: indole-3-glycerol phosphate synthase TrpC [Dinghuibacter sp.]|nr:indole-3-glycerol phosphate synthase TrpC [Dinghuibacter sp.]
MNILEQIVQQKHHEVAQRKQVCTTAELRNRAHYNRVPLSLAKALQQPGSTGIIAEFKKRSPSKGIINGHAVVEEVVAGYEAFGAAGISVLTDEQFFGGNLAHLEAARQTVNTPLLRKDFIIDEYQIEEARAAGADVVLLIAAILTVAETRRLAAYATRLNLEVLLELHDAAELEYICDETTLIGINNRNLKNFSVDIEQSIRLAEQIPANKIKIAESGIDAPETITRLKQHGFSGFLMGEFFMKQEQPALALQQLVARLNNTNTITS